MSTVVGYAQNFYYLQKICIVLCFFIQYFDQIRNIAESRVSTRQFDIRFGSFASCINIVVVAE